MFQLQSYERTYFWNGTSNYLVWKKSQSDIDGLRKISEKDLEHAAKIDIGIKKECQGATGRKYHEKNRVLVIDI